MNPEFFKKHSHHLRAAATRVSIERDLPLDLCLAMAAAAGQQHSLLVSMRALGAQEKQLEVAGLNFLATWELVGKAFQLAPQRCSDAAMDLLGEISEIKKAFVEEYSKQKAES